jgi:hypothetical protein
MEVRVRFMCYALSFLASILLLGAYFISTTYAWKEDSPPVCEVPSPPAPLPPLPSPPNTSGGGGPDGRIDGGYTVYYFPPKSSPISNHPPSPKPSCIPISNLKVTGKTLTWDGSPPFFVRYGIHKLNLNNGVTTKGNSFVAPGHYWFGIINLCGIKIIDP